MLPLSSLLHIPALLLRCNRMSYLWQILSHLQEPDPRRILHNVHYRS